MGTPFEGEYSYRIRIGYWVHAGYTMGTYGILVEMNEIYLMEP
ncbi:hypothetical protein A2U01_0076276, partial [Trifolium medium]|nr:hypothetical protein [Trifolium medium]